ncbi:FIG00785302: hypothetical protein [hydrothermal vent metagenome]|uniref:Hydrazine synthase alpha subunit middle domain-containing protein n=1 Tax=hydrothermal vent metagenome TaxID=652676 RepID=A0A3B0XYR6_9ZZZZ
MRNIISNFFIARSARRIPQIIQIPLLVAAVSLLASCDGTETGSDPGIQTFPVVYVKRTIQVDNQGDFIQPDLRRPTASAPGGDIYIKSRATVSAPAVNLTAAITNLQGDVKDLDVSSDGKTLVFSLLTEDLTPNDNSDNPKWDIYTYSLETGIVSRVIPSDIIAGEGDDIAPYFLPNNNKIVFSSNRQKQSRAVLLNEKLNVSKPQFSAQDEDNREKALVLHVMDADGSNIEQISFNQSHDLDPVVLSNGRILFSRWDNMNRNDAINLYTILQDGSDLQPYYGTHDESHAIPNVSNNSLQFIKPREMPDGRIMLLQLPFSGTFAGGEIVAIDAENFVDLNQPTTANMGAVSASAVQKVTVGSLKFDGSPAAGGRYSSFYPLNDGTSRILVSKGLCQIEIDTSGGTATPPTLEPRPCLEPYLSDPTANETYPSYGIWLYDSSELTEKPVEIVESGKFLSDAVVMRPYLRATVDLGKSDTDPNFDLTLESEDVGLLNIRSIYDLGVGDGVFNGCFFNECLPTATITAINNAVTALPGSTNFTPQQRTAAFIRLMGDPALVPANDLPARFIRIVKAVGLPNRRDPDLANPPDLTGRAFGRGGRRLGMKEVVGYSPIQPDGSIIVKVPANIAFYFEILDKDARRIGPRHENWLQVKAGDTLKCTGCHSHPGGTNPPLALPHGRINAEAAALNSGAPADGFNYPNTQDPATTAPYFANAGDTMAEVLSRAQGAQSVTTSITPSVNIEFRDFWTDPLTLTPTASFSSVYTGISTAEVSSLTTPSPNVAACEANWDSTCRTVINYQEHIQPIWEVDRAVNTCTSCHAPVNGASAAMVPAAQLDLTATDPSDEENQHIESYRELFFNDNFQELNGNTLVDTLITRPAVDENGNPVLDQNGVQLTEQVPDPSLRLSPSMSANGARVSYFMEKMTGVELDAGRTISGTTNHVGMLTRAELRLISEYLDIGGQYFNNPFDPAAPSN